MGAAVNSNPRRPASPPPAESGVGVPVLWHLKVSNYNEKARWALDYKRVAHVRRALVPGSHRRVAERLSGGRTLPVLVLDGEALGDSTRIIEALERRHPQPALYPRDPIERQRALELEDYFDEELGPCCRLLFLHQALPDTRLMLGAFAPDLTGVPLLAARARFPLMRRRIRTQFAIDAASVARAYDTLQAAGERFRTELGPGGYLVGETFTVADLTLAALVAPIVAPESFSYPQPQRGHPRLAPVRDALAESGILQWTREIYERHRGRSAALSLSETDPLLADARARRPRGRPRRSRIARGRR
jgi:glutathione S-transferase